jgi:hypothetical protein
MLIAYFFMNKDDVSYETKRLRAGKKQMKRFSELNRLSKRTFFELHCFTFRHLYNQWIRDFRASAPLPPNFTQTLSISRMRLHHLLSLTFYPSI